ncbi:uncharacterized protein LOC109594321 [Aethina tumida]|uniref:uncharacterized protein LOC109594321 n=1 Tax=Aethina tumida TaxID=116153 RepID=UPI00096B273F|nr:uncharacterized protein LOC109594321 [Aethina tumida]
MISKKEYILTRPWQERKYAYHRRKVQSAVPAIDNKPPAMRPHVSLKLKKQQKEKERTKQIEWENFLLLQRLNYITRTNRVDNYWKTPQPGFLNRVGLYNNGIYTIEDEDSGVSDIDSDAESSRKSRCSACRPKREKNIQIPEERIPWEPEKKPTGRIRSKSVPARKTGLPSIKEEQPQKHRPKTTSHKKDELVEIKSDFDKKHGQSLIITRGCLKLCVKIPPDTTVKFQNGTKQQTLSRGLCSCKALSGPH